MPRLRRMLTADLEVKTVLYSFLLLHDLRFVLNFLLHVGARIFVKPAWDGIGSRVLPNGQLEKVL